MKTNGIHKEIYIVEVNVNLKMDVEVDCDGVKNAMDKAWDVAGDLINDIRIQNPEKYTNVETDLDIRAGEIGYVLKKG